MATPVDLFFKLIRDGDSKSVHESGLQDSTLLVKTRENNFSPLHVAAREGHGSVVEALLELGMDPNTMGGKDGKTTALHIAASAGRMSVVRILVDRGALISLRDGDGKSPVDRCICIWPEGMAYEAAQRGDLALVNQCLEAMPTILNTPDSLGETLLHYACRGGDVGVIRYLYECGADVTATCPDGGTMLHVTAAYGHLNACAFLTKLPINKDAKDVLGYTAVHRAVVREWYHVVSLLLETGADPSVKGKDKRTAFDVAKTDRMRILLWPPFQLLHAVDGCDTAEVNRCLSEDGFSPDTRFPESMGRARRSCLHVAASGFSDHHRAIARMLLNHGAQIDLVDEHGYQPLHLASSLGMKEMVQLLLDAGADRFSLANGGETPVDIADSPAIVDLLCPEFALYAAIIAEVRGGLTPATTPGNSRPPSRPASRSQGREGAAEFKDGIGAYMDNSLLGQTEDGHARGTNKAPPSYLNELAAMAGREIRSDVGSSIVGNKKAFRQLLEQNLHKLHLGELLCHAVTVGNLDAVNRLLEVGAHPDGLRPDPVVKKKRIADTFGRQQADTEIDADEVVGTWNGGPVTALEIAVRNGFERLSSILLDAGATQMPTQVYYSYASQAGGRKRHPSNSVLTSASSLREDISDTGSQQGATELYDLLTKLGIESEFSKLQALGSLNAVTDQQLRALGVKVGARKKLLRLQREMGIGIQEGGICEVPSSLSSGSLNIPFPSDAGSDDDTVNHERTPRGGKGGLASKMRKPAFTGAMSSPRARGEAGVVGARMRRASFASSFETQSEFSLAGERKNAREVASPYCYGKLPNDAQRRLVAHFLDSIGLSQYIDTFAAANITYNDLPRLSDLNLRQVGMKGSKGNEHRVKFRQAVRHIIPSV
eukprot:Rmarinus@m.21896